MNEQTWWSNVKCIRLMTIQFIFGDDGIEVVHSNRTWYPIWDFNISWDSISNRRLEYFWENRLVK